MEEFPNPTSTHNGAKDEAKEALKTVGFESLVILQPSRLLGERAKSRRGERTAIITSRVLAPLLRPLASRPHRGPHCRTGHGRPGPGPTPGCAGGSVRRAAAARPVGRTNSFRYMSGKVPPHGGGTALLGPTPPVPYAT